MSARSRSLTFRFRKLRMKIIQLLRRSRLLSFLLWGIRESIQSLVYVYTSNRLPFLRESLGKIRLHYPENSGAPRRAGADFARKSRSLVRGFQEAQHLSNIGQHHASVTLKAQILAEAYELAGLEVKTHSPRALSPYFSSNAGHLGILALFVLAQQLDLLDRSKRDLLHHLPGNQQVFDGIKHHFNVVSVKGHHWPSGVMSPKSIRNEELTPALWPHVERLATLKIHRGFEDYYALHQSVSDSLGGFTRQKSPFLLSERYLNESAERLKISGLRPENPFIALHIREAGTGDFRSPSSLDSYFPAVRLALSHGYQVVRFGLEGMTPMPIIPGLVDLVRLMPGDNSLDFFALSQSSFMISTQSGPASVACAAGVPLLMTNTTSIGRNSIVAPAHSIYLPKKYLDLRGRQMSFRDVLQHPLGYSESLRVGDSRPFQSVANSAGDIEAGTLEIIEKLEGRRSVDETLRNKILRVRSEEGAISRGDISESFVHRNPRWLHDR